MLPDETCLIAVVILERSEESRREINKLIATLLEDDTVRLACEVLVETRITNFIKSDLIFLKFFLTFVLNRDKIFENFKFKCVEDIKHFSVSFRESAVAVSRQISQVLSRIRAELPNRSYGLHKELRMPRYHGYGLLRVL